MFATNGSEAQGEAGDRKKGIINFAIQLIAHAYKIVTYYFEPSSFEVVNLPHEAAIAAPPAPAVIVFPKFLEPFGPPIKRSPQQRDLVGYFRSNGAEIDTPNAEAGARSSKIGCALSSR